MEDKKAKNEAQRNVINKQIMAIRILSLLFCNRLLPTNRRPKKPELGRTVRTVRTSSDFEVRTDRDLLPSTSLGPRL